MKKRKKLRAIIWIIVSVFFACDINAAQGYADTDQVEGLKKNQTEQLSDNQQEEQKTVRVGYLFAEGYQTGGENEPKSGFGYEYYQEISYYTNWKYEYVYAGFADCLEMLENGEIDIMGNLSYTPERAEKINFSTPEQGEEEYYIYAPAEQTQIVPGDYTTLNGKRIAISEGSYQAELFKTWCEEKGIDCILVPYDNSVKRIEAVNNGDVDATLSATITTRNANNEHWQSIAKFGSSPFYFGVNKDRPDILKELNDAMIQIQSKNPFFNEDVYQRNVTGEALQIINLTDDETAWIQENAPLTIGCMEDYSPFCYQKELGQMEGIFPEIFRFIGTEQKIDFKYNIYQSYDELFQALYSGEVDAVVPVYSDYWVAEQQNTCILKEVTNVGAVLIYKDSKLTLNEMISSLAISKNSLVGEYYQKKYYLDAQVEVCDTVEECYDYLKKGKVNAILTDASIANRSSYRREVEKKNLYTLDLSENVPVSVAVRKGDVMMLNVLTKGLNLVPDSVISNAMLQSANDMIDYTFEDYVRANIIQVVLVGLLAICLLFAFILWFLTTKSRFKRVKEKSEKDGLTGFYNKQTGSAMIEQLLQESDKKYAMMILDIDDFKSANDVYGHSFGDKVIRTFAERLTKSTRSNDILVRVGGDEFLAFIDYDGDIRPIAERITGQVNGTIDDFDLSLSIGVVTTDQAPRNYKQLFDCADSVLYDVKRRGKKGYKIYQASL